MAVKSGEWKADRWANGIFQGQGDIWAPTHADLLHN